MMEQQYTSIALEETAVQELVSRMRGALLRPGDVGYEQALRVYNGMIDKRPALIAHCVDVADVIAAVNFARLAQIKARYDPSNLFHVNQNIAPTR